MGKMKSKSESISFEERAADILESKMHEALLYIAKSVFSFFPILMMKRYVSNIAMQ